MEFVAKPTTRFSQSIRHIPILGPILLQPLGALGFCIVILFVLTTIFAHWIAPFDPIQQHIDRILEPPSSEFILGTDYLGRDLLSRMIYGSRIAISAAIPAISIALTFGLSLGMLAGYVGGKVDNIILVLLDSIQAFPGLILALAILALLGPSFRNVVIVIGLAFIPGYARVTRAQVLAVKKNDYIEAEINLGASSARIIFSHVFPNILGPIAILVAMDTPAVITFEAGLSFIGLGVRPPDPSWGVILSDGFKFINRSPYPILWAGLALMITTLGFTLFGESLRDVIDPRLSGTRGL
jgi:peptide/nickel transport system permease protein